MYPGLAIFIGALGWNFFGRNYESTPTMIPAEVSEHDSKRIELKLQENPSATTPSAPPALPSQVLLEKKNLNFKSSQPQPAGSDAKNRTNDLTHADILEGDGIVRDSRGNLLKMNQEEAVNTCAKRGMHLPTIRELAKICQSRGAKGILETSKVQEGGSSDNLPLEYSPNNTEDDTYYLYSVKNSNGKRDEFYFNPRGYVAPPGDLGNQNFLSSSVHFYRAGQVVLGLNGKNGVLSDMGFSDSHGYNGPSPTNDLRHVHCLMGK